MISKRVKYPKVRNSRVDKDFWWVAFFKNDLSVKVEKRMFFQLSQLADEWDPLSAETFQQSYNFKENERRISIEARQDIEMLVAQIREEERGVIIV